MQYALHVAAYYRSGGQDDLFHYWYYVSGNYLRLNPLYAHWQDEVREDQQSGPRLVSGTGGAVRPTCTDSDNTDLKQRKGVAQTSLKRYR